MATCECRKRAIKIAEKARRSVNSELEAAADDGVADELRNVRHVHDGELLEKHRRTTRARSDAEFSSAISGR